MVGKAAELFEKAQEMGYRSAFLSSKCGEEKAYEIIEIHRLKERCEQLVREIDEQA